MPQKKRAEGSIIRPIAETSRNDGHELAARLHQGERERDKGRIKVNGLYAGETQDEAVFRGAVDLFVRRIQNGVRETAGSLHSPEGRLQYKVTGQNLARDGQPFG